tara:strand:+ start:6759 stop:7127 length:369 start_codon:yes stop_codon:yes gene_type:complete
MASLSTKLPLTYSSIDGFAQIKTFKSLTRQNFKMLLLTAPGERVMIPSYGVGLKTYLFSLYGESTQSKIIAKINEQVELYMPYIKVNNIDFTSSEPDLNRMEMKISYSIPSIGVADLLDLTI